MLPLYSKAQVGSLEDEGKNYGLYFEKFFDGWQIDSNATDKKKVSDGWKITCNATDKKKFFENVKKVNTPNDNEENPLLEDYLKRRHRLVRMLGGSIIQLSTVWRLVSGLGVSHPTEVGFVWHRTLGIPYLPGSSLKGMLRAWLTHWEKGELKRIYELFGDTDTCGQGRLIIFDALPLSPLKLEIDVMNSHYAPYYDNLNKPNVLQANPPADYYSPNPVFFLTVAPNQSFEFMLAPTPGLGTPKDLEEGVGLLKDALSTIGVGAKTAVGYGVFDKNFKN